ncbi:hypothetical protein NXV08_19285 [Bacteroides fragilis]|nr:hypothetical protein [Bacteroides fragilis]MCS3276781.1 hypothetical protein [Bacteroides fragilis]
MKYLTFPFLLLLLPLIGFGCSSEEKETDSLILSSDSEIFLSKALILPLLREPGIYRSRQDVHGGSR